MNIWTEYLGCRDRALEGRWQEDLRKVNDFIEPFADTVREQAFELSPNTFVNYSGLRSDIAEVNDGITTSASVQEGYVRACRLATTNS